MYKLTNHNSTIRLTHGKQGASMKKLLISAGHSASDPGAVVGSITEAKLALELRDLIAFELINGPFQVLTDGAKGNNLPLKDAVALAKKSDLAIEIHFNASANFTAQGVESISLASKKIASQKLSASISAVLGCRLRGESGWIDQSKSARGKLGFVEAGGIIVEVCFITNTQELAQYKERKQKLAAVLAKTLKELV